LPDQSPPRAPRPRRPTIPELDGFRAYAILGVVAYHILIRVSPAPVDGAGSELAFLFWGTVGGGLLNVFFIVGGCGLFLSVVARGGLGEVRAYARRRGARLLPAYWVTLTVTLALIVLTGATFPGIAEIMVQYTGLQQPALLVDPTATTGFGNGALWLISVILGFYVVLALVWRPYLRHPLVGLAVVAAITVGWKLAAVHLTGVFEAVELTGHEGQLVVWNVINQLPGWAYSFALGMTCAWAYVRLAEPRPRQQLERFALTLAPFVLVGFGVCAYLYAGIAVDSRSTAGAQFARSSSPILDLAYNTSRAALMAVIVLGPALLSKPFVNRPIRRFAELSYGVYLIHLVVVIYVCEMLLGLPEDGSVATAALWFAVVLPISIVYAYVVTRFVERPALAWAARRSSRPRPQTELPATSGGDQERGRRPLGLPTVTAPRG
jgi:peptidoglycan/LPS O-acetylase OafA/YrhL